MEYLMIGNHIEAFPLEDDRLQIFNRNTGKTYTLGKSESFVFQLLNGTNSVDDVLHNCPYYNKQEIEALIKAFSDIGFFDKEKTIFNPFKIKLRLFNPNKLIKTESIITKLSHYAILFICPIIFIASIIAHQAIIKDSLYFYSQAMAGMADLGVADWLLVAFFSLLCLALHECAHMVSARRYGVNVPEIGVMLYFLIPCAYTNISGINLIKSKIQRLIILASGSLVNFAVIGTCNIIMCTATSKMVVSYSAAVALANIGTIIMNMMVLLKFDGYYALEVILGEPKFRDNALNFIIVFIKTIFSRNKTEKNKFKQILNAQENILRHIVYGVYFVFSVGYIPIILTNTVIPFFAR